MYRCVFSKLWIEESLEICSKHLQSSTCDPIVFTSKCFEVSLLRTDLLHHIRSYDICSQISAYTFTCINVYIYIYMGRGGFGPLRFCDMSTVFRKLILPEMSNEK